MGLYFCFSIPLPSSFARLQVFRVACARPCKHELCLRHGAV